MARQSPGPGSDSASLFQGAPPPPDERPEYSEEIRKRTHNYPKHKVLLARRTRETLENMSDRERRRTLKAIFVNIREGLRFEVACAIADVPTEWLADQMSKDEGLRLAVLRERALTERELVRAVRAGGPGAPPAKMALEILERTFNNWSRKTSVTLASFLEDALKELKTRLDANTYDVVVRVLEKHSSGSELG